MSRSPPLPFRVAAVLVILGVVIVTIVRSTTVADAENDQDDVLAEIDRLRSEAFACNADLAREEGRFREFDRHVDSLRAEVGDYESNERTVPAAEFERYLDTFDTYNESVGAWRDRADELQARWQDCAELTAKHNALADSANRLLRDASR